MNNERFSPSDSSTANAEAKGPLAQWDTVLNEQYQELMQRLNPDQKQLLKQSELDWIDFRNKETKSIDKALKNSGIPAENIAYDKTNITMDRATQLEQYNYQLTHDSKVDGDDAKEIHSEMKSAYFGDDHELNSTYQQLRSSLKPDAQQVLKQAELAWIKFEGSNANFLYSQPLGTNQAFQERIDGLEIRNSELQTLLKARKE